MSADRILVIKHGALGDFILAMGPFAAIRAHHPESHVTLLTTPPYAGLGEASGYFDAVWSETRPAWWRLGERGVLRRRLRGGGFARVYDLQTSRRSSAYLRWFDAGSRPEWSGIARGCSHPHANPARGRMHTVDRHRDQLAAAGIADVPDADLSWLDADISRFDLPADFALLVPGGSPRRLDKRWPADRYAALGADLSARGIVPVLLGAVAERDAAAAIAAACPAAVDLVGGTDLAQIAALARGARVAVGNDTGPMHIIAAAGCRSVVLFSNASDPALCAPRGRSVQILRADPLSALPVETVAAAADAARGGAALTGSGGDRIFRPA